MESHSKKTHGSIHDFTVKDARGNDVDLSNYKGIFFVNYQCRFTIVCYIILILFVSLVSLVQLWLMYNAKT
ncbi:hypothetical protein MKX01_014164 [Papaver californicum]|nr:hypothetical protein MKX01_014164 [Papaver californicum]